MSSLLIKGMEMPCACVFCELYDGDLYWCRGAKKEVPYSPEDKRAEFCPLVPVPPHGELIDRNKLYEKTTEWEAQALYMVKVHRNDEDTTEWRNWSTVLTERIAFKFDVADAPTIIEAEDEE